jgi:hypothetical protein
VLNHAILMPDGPIGNHGAVGEAVVLGIHRFGQAQSNQTADAARAFGKPALAIPMIAHQKHPNPESGDAHNGNNWSPRAHGGSG